MNGDGKLDVFVAGYTDVNIPTPGATSGFPANDAAVRDLLYLNNGGTGRYPTFREVGRSVGLEPNRPDHGLGASFVDVDTDGRPDLYVANDLGPNRLHVNVTAPRAADCPLGFRFRRAGSGGARRRPEAGMGVAAGDYSGDGLDDLLVTNSPDSSTPRTAAARASRSPTHGRRSPPRSARARRVGATWADLDNDGRLEIAIANGAIPIQSLARDAEQPQVVTTDGRVHPLDVGRVAPRNGRGLAAADFDNDGDVDLALASIGGRLQLLRNDGATGHWLEVSLRRLVPGTRVTVVLDDGAVSWASRARAGATSHRRTRACTSGSAGRAQCASWSSSGPAAR